MPNIHPLIVHFPIALIIVIMIMDFLGVLSRRQSFISTANILTIFAAVGAAVAVVSGLIAEESVWRPGEANDLIELHETVGLAVLGMTLISLIFRLTVKKNKSGWPGWMAVILSLIASALVGYGGYIGGEMVYKYGTGVRQAEIATAKADSLSALHLNTETENIFKEEAEGQNKLDY